MYQSYKLFRQHNHHHHSHHRFYSMMDSQQLLFNAEELVIEKALEGCHSLDEVIAWAQEYNLYEHPVVQKKMGEISGEFSVSSLDFSADNEILYHAESQIVTSKDGYAHSSNTSVPSSPLDKATRLHGEGQTLLDPTLSEVINDLDLMESDDPGAQAMHPLLPGSLDSIPSLGSTLDGTIMAELMSSQLDDFDVDKILDAMECSTDASVAKHPDVKIMKNAVLDGMECSTHASAAKPRDVNVMKNAILDGMECSTDASAGKTRDVKNMNNASRHSDVDDDTDDDGDDDSYRFGNVDSAIRMLNSVEELKQWAEEFDLLQHAVVRGRLAQLGDTEAFVDTELESMRDFDQIDRWAHKKGFENHPAVRQKLIAIASDFGIVEAEQNLDRIREFSKTNDIRNFPIPRIVKSHMVGRGEVGEDHVETDESKHNCELCGKCFRYPQDLKRHVRSKHENIKYPCAKCQKKFSSAFSRSRHQLRCSLTNAKPGFHCTECNKLCVSTSGLKRHMAKHNSKQNPITCKTCNTECENRKELYQHKQRCA